MPISRRDARVAALLILHGGNAGLWVAGRDMPAYLSGNEAARILKGPAEMSTNTSHYLHLDAIELEARRMRAQMVSAAITKAVAWLRKPHKAAPAINGHTA